jgi:hypothetical protein
VADALGELGKGWAKSFSPVSLSEMEISKRPVDFAISTIIPTVMKPIFNIYADQTNFGAPLTPAFKNPDKLKSDQANRTTPAVYTEIAKEIHDMTGIDMYPDHVRALSDGVLIGPFHQIVQYLIDNPSKEVRGEKTSVPLIGSLIDSINDRSMLNQIYSRVRGDMDSVHREITTLRANRDPDQQITPEMQKTEIAYQQFKGQEHVLGLQRQALKKMAASLDADVLAMKTQQIEDRADSVHRKMLVSYYNNR